MKLTAEKIYPQAVYDLLSFMRDLGKRECLTDLQLEDAKKMIKWATAAKGNDKNSFTSPFKDKDGLPVYLHRTPQWFKTKFVDPATLATVDKKEGFCCNFCDVWTINKGECAYCFIGRCQ